jgi:REP element-mobilizing transposase RayT
MIYHFVCPAKYRRVVFDEEVDEILKEICQEIEKRYDIRFLEIGTDKDHVHFLIQSVPKVSATQIIRTIKSITAREIFVRRPQVKKQLWGGEFWSDGYFVSTVGQHGNEETISKYVKNQGIEEEYKSMLKQPLQLSLFD